MNIFCNYKNYLVNGTFGEPDIETNSYKYYTGTQVKGWDFNSGVIIDDSKAWGFPTPYPCGRQACSIQKKASISQIFSVPKAGIYSLVVYYVGRNGVGNTLNFILNDKQIYTLTNPPIGVWNYFIIELNLSIPTNNKLEIVGTGLTDISTAIQLILTNQIRSKLDSSTLKPTERLNIGQYKYSDNRKYFMTLKSDGNLCVFNDVEEQIWCSNKSGSSKPFAVFQTDGNLCVYQFIGDKQSGVWCSMSNGQDRTNASLDNDGIIRVWDKSNRVVWASTSTLISTSTSTNFSIQQNESTSQISNVDFNYNISSVPIYILGDYGMAPWGRNTFFPDQTAKWIWYTEKANINSPNNTSSPTTIQYVYSNKSGIQINGNLNIIIDNNCTIFLNSKELKRNNNTLIATGGWNQGNNSWNIFPFTIEPGENLFEFKVINTGGPGGLLVSAITIGAGPDNNKVLFHTDNTWKFIPIPSQLVPSCNLSQSGLITTTDKSFPWGSLSLNGTSQFVSIGKIITGMSGLSFGLWFKSNESKNFSKIIDFGNGATDNNIMLYIHNNTLGACVYIMNKSYDIIPKSMSPNINDNKWYHMVWTIQPTTTGSNYTIYLNNNMVSTVQGSYPINIERTKCFIGKSNLNTDPYFSGSISNFVMYQKVLSPKEINGLYLSMINLMDPKLYIYLPFSTNSVLDTLLNNYAGKTYSLPITKSKVENENWTCVEDENKKWIGVKMEKGMPVCMSLDGKICIESTQQECKQMESNPVVPQNPVICTETKSGWCANAKTKLLSGTIYGSISTPSIPSSLSSGTPIDTIKPGVASLSALSTPSTPPTPPTLNSAIQSNVGEKSLNLKPLPSGGQILSLANMVDVDNLLIGGTFKLRVNLPNMPPYIKGETFDMSKGVNPNYFYLSVEKLDPNCNIKTANNKCVQTFADDKKCNIKALTSYVQSNTFRLVLVSSGYVLDPSIPMGKNSDFTLVKVNGQLYLKNVQTGYLPSLYSNDMVLSVYGDMEVKSNSNVNQIYSQLNNTLCDQQIPPVQTTGTSFVKCDIKQDPGIYLITTKNIGSSSPIRVNINTDKTISLNLLSFNSYGYPTKIYSLTSCNFNVQTYAYIEKMTNNLGTFMVNMVCFEDTQNNKANQKNQLKFTVELVNFPSNFVKDNSIFQIN